MIREVQPDAVGGFRNVVIDTIPAGEPRDLRLGG